MTYYDRSESRQRALLDAAERLLALKKQSQRPLTTTNQHHEPTPPKVPTPAEQQTGALTRALQARLARGDQRGGSSGRDVGE